jgi:hypothetical protein
LQLINRRFVPSDAERLRQIITFIITNLTTITTFFITLTVFYAIIIFPSTAISS